MHLRLYAPAAKYESRYSRICSAREPVLQIWSGEVYLPRPLGKLAHRPNLYRAKIARVALGITRQHPTIEDLTPFILEFAHVRLFQGTGGISLVLHVKMSVAGIF